MLSCVQPIPQTTAPPPPVLVRSSIPACTSTIDLAPLLPDEIYLETGTRTPDVLLVTPDTNYVLDSTRSHSASLVTRCDCSQPQADAKELIACVHFLDSKGWPAPPTAPTISAPPPPPLLPCPPSPQHASQFNMHIYSELMRHFSVILCGYSSFILHSIQLTNQIIIVHLYLLWHQTDTQRHHPCRNRNEKSCFTTVQYLITMMMRLARDRRLSRRSIHSCIIHSLDARYIISCSLFPADTNIYALDTWCISFIGV